MYEEYYRTRINSNMNAECANKCNECQGEKERTEVLAPIEPETTVDLETCPMNPCNTPFVLKKFIKCGQVIDTEQIACELPAPPATPDSECSVLCGPGTKNITTQVSICEPPVVTTVPCQGRLGKIVEQPPNSWSACSESCGGGVQTRQSTDVCELKNENNQVVEIKRKDHKQSCSMYPCAYWGGWSVWSMS